MKPATSKSEGAAFTSKTLGPFNPSEACWRATKPPNQSTQSVGKQRNEDNWESAMLLNTHFKIGFQTQGEKHIFMLKFIFFYWLIVFALFRKWSFSLWKLWLTLSGIFLSCSSKISPSKRKNQTPDRIHQGELISTSSAFKKMFKIWCFGC